MDAAVSAGTRAPKSHAASDPSDGVRRAGPGVKKVAGAPRAAFAVAAGLAAGLGVAGFAVSADASEAEASFDNDASSEASADISDEPATIADRAMARAAASLASSAGGAVPSAPSRASATGSVFGRWPARRGARLGSGLRFPAARGGARGGARSRSGEARSTPPSCEARGGEPAAPVRVEQLASSVPSSESETFGSMQHARSELIASPDAGDRVGARSASRAT